MTIKTNCIFYYGHTIDDTNSNLDFKEGGGPEITATLDIGDYTFEEFAAEIEKALNAASTLPQVYTVVANRATQRIEVSSTGTFSLLVSSGSHLGTSCWDLMGFTGSDRTGASSYKGDSQSGSSYIPAFLLQEYVDPENQEGFISPAVNLSASGQVEVIKFGTENFLNANITMVSDIPQDNRVIRTDLNGVANLRTFMRYLITKAKIEFMPDIGDRDTFEKLLLESTPESETGTAFLLKELTDRGLAGYYETGQLKFRRMT